MTIARNSRLPWHRSQYLAVPGVVAPADVIAVRVRGVTHEGLVSDVIGPDGRPLVISKSKRRGAVAEESWRDFCGGRLPWVVGYIGERCPCCVLAEARSRIGEPWTIVRNCQHFVRECHGLPSQSPGLHGASVSGIVAVAGLAAVLALS